MLLASSVLHTAIPIANCIVYKLFKVKDFYFPLLSFFHHLRFKVDRVAPFAVVFRIYLSKARTKYRSNKVTATPRFNIPRSSQRCFQLRAIGSWYYTRVRRPLSQNRLRNDAKSLHGDRTHSRQTGKNADGWTGAKNKAPRPRRMTRGGWKGRNAALILAGSAT